MFVRNESFQGFIRSYPIITGLVAIHIILYIWVYFLPFFGGTEIRNWGIGSNLHVGMGEYWRLVTPIFLHGSITHMLFNSFSLVLFGPALESLLGKFRFITAYFLTGIIANIATFYLGEPVLFHLGASGAIYGLFGIYLYMVLNRQDLIDQGNSQVIMTILVIGVIMTFVNPGINILAHLFGLLAGALLGPLILYKVSRYGQYRRASDTDEVTFDPNRWEKKRRNLEKMKVAAIVVGTILLFFILLRIIF
ncbi:rhomboid family intramembrane serine protease [Evansella tamaricis]|uniref:Rhomboid family intramembrane serine protease n=1 Tax=Evansella tamaricis TaxID=2069301 RepID=A0ABS6J9R9_9BACI|nr:rhomboid family intramembrane serine protease [Evansella tamaricis]MBU9710427.1 rhomboid family intramembrane serine protease [Evansella tamaricis]